MSFQITEAFRQEFADNFMHVAQQTGSRLESTVGAEPNIVGMSKTVNRLGLRSAQRRTTRHSDTPINDQPHSTRVLDLFDWEDGDMLDDPDKVRMLGDPQSEYVKAMVAAMNRAKDDVIISALGGSARATSAGGIGIGVAPSPIILPASQKIAVGGTGLTKAKVFQAKKLFRQNEADEESGEELFMLYHSQALVDILGDTQLTSSDFNAVEMIQNGSLKGTWMGFKWVPIERCPKVATTRFTYAYAKSAAKLGTGSSIKVKVGEDSSKSFNTRVYVSMTIGAVRVEEEKVVEIACLDP